MIAGTTAVPLDGTGRPSPIGMPHLVPGRAVCGYRYQESPPSTTLGVCECGMFAVGICSECGVTLCGDHIHLVQDRRLCTSHAREKVKRAAAQAERETLQAREAVDDARLTARREKAEAERLLAAVRSLGPVLEKHNVPGAVRITEIRIGSALCSCRRSCKAWPVQRFERTTVRRGSGQPGRGHDPLISSYETSHSIAVSRCGLILDLGAKRRTGFAASVVSEVRPDGRTAPLDHHEHTVYQAAQMLAAAHGIAFPVPV